MKKFFTLIAVAVMAFAAQATELTVCDGEDTNNYVPIYGLYVDTDGTFGQMIYSADMLTDMVGKEITGVKFYSPNINFSGATLQVGLAVTEKNDFEDYEAVVGATALGTTQPNLDDTEMTFVFDEPYLYEGGNLMVQVLVTEVGTWKGTSFYGVNMPYYYSFYQYQSAWSSTPSKYHEAFLPKATFTYEGGEVPPVVYDETCSAPNGQYVIIDKEKALVTITNNEPGATVHYVVTLDGELVEEGDFTGEVWEYIAVGAGDWRISCVASMPGMNDSEPGGVFFPIAPGQTPVAVDEMMAGKTVSSVRYYNVAGQEMQEANGMTIVVTTYTDGTTSAVKVIK